MDGLKALQMRVSVPRLTTPTPSQQDLEEAFKAALRAADHGKLQPWRFLVIKDEGLESLSDVFVAGALAANPEVSPAVLEKCKKMPGRAPMIIVAIACLQDNPGVPHQEQIIACGAATQNLLNALFIQGFGAVWRSGDMASNPYVCNKLGIAQSEEIIGYIYVGTPSQEVPSPPEVDVNAFFKPWPAK